MSTTKRKWTMTYDPDTEELMLNYQVDSDGTRQHDESITFPKGEASGFAQHLAQLKRRGDPLPLPDETVDAIIKLYTPAT